MLGGVSVLNAITQVFLDLHLPDLKRFRKTLQLWGPIDASASSFKFYGTKVRC